MPADTSTWEYTIKIGRADEVEIDDTVLSDVYVFQILDDLGETLHEGIADDVQDAITQVAETILNVHDEIDASS